MNYESADYKGGVSVGVRSCDVWLFGDEYTTIIGKLLDSNEFKKTITINGKTMNVKEFFLNDNIDAVNWYYKRDNNYLTYYKVWEGENKAYLEITFELTGGTAKNIVEEGIKTKEKELAKKIIEKIKKNANYEE